MKRALVAWWPILFLLGLAVFVWLYIVALPRAGTT